MKKLSLILIASLFSFVVNAQSTETTQKDRVGKYQAHHDGKSEKRIPEEQAKNMTDRLSEKLSLTEEQKLRVHQLHLEKATKRQALREQKAEEAMINEEMKTIRKEFHEGMKKVLTDEQYALWKEDSKSGHHKHRSKDMKGGQRDSNPNKSKTE